MRTRNYLLQLLPYLVFVWTDYIIFHSIFLMFCLVCALLTRASMALIYVTEVLIMITWVIYNIGKNVLLIKYICFGIGDGLQAFGKLPIFMYTLNRLNIISIFKSSSKINRQSNGSSSCCWRLSMYIQKETNTNGFLDPYEVTETCRLNIVTRGISIPV